MLVLATVFFDLNALSEILQQGGRARQYLTVY
jgi:hypothetical protein